MVLSGNTAIVKSQPSKHFDREYVLKLHLIIHFLAFFPSGGASLEPSGHRNCI